MDENQKDLNETIEVRETIQEEKAEVNQEVEATQVDEVNLENSTEEVEEQEPKLSFARKIQNSFRSRKFKNGAYATTISIVVVAIVLFVNIFVSKFNWKVDLSTNSLFSISKTTKEFIKGLDEDITMYYLVQSGGENVYFSELAKKYDALSSHITLEYKDPNLYPKFSKQYTDEQVMENSVIVVNNSNNRSKYVSYSDMVQRTYSQMGQSSVSGIDFEGKVTAAIQYVTNEDTPVYYQVTGHGETEAGSAFTGMLDKLSIELKTLTTAKETSIPSDCKVLIINGPYQDYSEDEVTMIKDYLIAGGKVIFLVDSDISQCKNLLSLMEYYGVGIVDGIVVEGDYDYMIQHNPNYIIPDVNTEAEILSEYEKPDNFLFLTSNVGIKKLDTVRSTIKYENILTTSDKAYSKTNLKSNTIEKEVGDIEGPFALAASISETYDNVKTSILVLNRSLAADSILEQSAFADYDLVAYLMNQFSDSKVEALAIPVKTYDSSSLTFNGTQLHLFMAFAIVIFPVLILVFGIVVVVRRGKK